MFSTLTCSALIPLSEALLCSSPLISHAVIFGAGRFLNGTILNPSRSLSPYTEETIKSYLDEVWPHIVSHVNPVVPRHSRLVRPLVLVANPEKPFLFSDKGTVKSRVSVAQYGEEIDAAYRFMESGDDGTECGRPLPFDPLDNKSAEAYVGKLISDILGHAVEPNKDLFSVGLDSLLATRLRMEINACIKKAGITSTLSRNAVYAHPTTAALTQHLQSFVASCLPLKSDGHAINGHVPNERIESPASVDPESSRNLIEQTIATFTSSFPEHRSGHAAAPNGWVGDVYAVSGTTGSLGATFVSVLLQQFGIDKIYLMNRRSPDGISTAQRHRASFEDKGLDASKLEEAVSAGRVVYLEIELGEPKLGLTDAVYEQVRTSYVRSYVMH